jgi:hypothetical protein
MDGILPTTAKKGDETFIRYDSGFTDGSQVEKIAVSGDEIVGHSVHGKRKEKIILRISTLSYARLDRK